MAKHISGLGVRSIYYQNEQTWSMLHLLLLLESKVDIKDSETQTSSPYNCYYCRANLPNVVERRIIIIIHQMVGLLYHDDGFLGSLDYYLICCCVFLQL